jgi:hypothetical protein
MIINLKGCLKRAASYVSIWVSDGDRMSFKRFSAASFDFWDSLFLFTNLSGRKGKADIICQYEV